MKIRSWWNSRSLFWKVYILIVLVILLVVVSVEVVLEPLLEEALRVGFDDRDFHELILWGFTITILAAICGSFITKYLSREIQKLADMAKRIAKGDLSARIRDTGDDKDSLNQLALSFNDMAESLEKLLANERRLLADISHELRSPLTRMGLAKDIMARQIKEPELVTTLGRVDKELERMRELVSLLLQQGKHRLSSEECPEKIDLSILLRGLAEDYLFQARENGKDLGVSIPSGLMINGHAMLMQSIFSNVLSNALFYSPEGAAVDLRAERNEDYVNITVRDYGPGVPEEALEDIFRAFYRVERSRDRSQGGAGLGLALAKDAVVTHHGEIRAANAQPGLKVTIRLPLDKA